MVISMRWLDCHPDSFQAVYNETPISGQVKMELLESSRGTETFFKIWICGRDDGAWEWETPSLAHAIHTFNEIPQFVTPRLLALLGFETF